jgi:hypothetical protein
VRPLLLILIALTAAPVAAQEASTQALVDQLLADAEAYDARCRGGSGDDPETWSACGARDYAGYLLGQQGWCYGVPGQIGAEQAWAPCEGPATPLPRPPS